MRTVYTCVFERESVLRSSGTRHAPTAAVTTCAGFARSHRMQATKRGLCVCACCKQKGVRIKEKGGRQKREKEKLKKEGGVKTESEKNKDKHVKKLCVHKCMLVCVNTRKGNSAKVKRGRGRDT